MAKKGDFQKELSKLLDQAKVKFQKIGKEMGVLAKKSEKEIVKASRAGKIQLDLLGLNVRKEKLYYDIGKKAAALNAKSKLNISELEPYWKKLGSIGKDSRKKKRELLTVRRERKNSGN